MERDHVEGLDVVRRIILKWIFKKYVETCTVLIWLRIGINSGCCEHGHELPGYKNAGNLLNRRESISFLRRTVLYRVSCRYS